MPLLIDTHCHLDDLYPKGQLKACLVRAAQAGVGSVISIGTHPADWEVLVRMAQDPDAYDHLAPQVPQAADLAPARVATLFYTLGLHPCYVTPQAVASLGSLAQLWQSPTPPVALGECGLDYYHLPSHQPAAAKALQYQAFEQQLALACSLDVPVVVHSRQALPDCLAILKSSGLAPARVVFHCFSEGQAAMHTLMDKGYRASFTGILTYKNAHEVRQACLAQGLENLMLETDAPYLAPVPKRGQVNEPAYVSYVAQACAELFGVDTETVAAITSANAQHFFGLKPACCSLPSAPSAASGLSGVGCVHSAAPL
jgi:TatD DNase family protein